MKKIIIGGMLLISTCFIVTGCDQKEVEEEIKFLDKCAIQEIDDQWIYSFCASYSKDQKGEFTVLREFDFNGYDLLKKDNTDRYIIPVINESTGEQVDELKAEMHALLYGSKKRNDVLKISNFFNGSDFHPEAVDQDIEKLNLDSIDRKIVLDLYKQAIHSVEKAFGKFGSIPMTATYDKKTVEGTFRIGYLINYGHIEYMKIDFIDQETGKFLSDLDKEGTIPADQKEDYEQLRKLEQEIVKQQKFNFEHIFQGKTMDTTALKALLEGIVNPL